MTLVLVPYKQAPPLLAFVLYMVTFPSAPYAVSCGLTGVASSQLRLPQVAGKPVGTVELAPPVADPPVDSAWNRRWSRWILPVLLVPPAICVPPVFVTPPVFDVVVVPPVVLVSPVLVSVDVPPFPMVDFDPPVLLVPPALVFSCHRYRWFRRRSRQQCRP